MSSHKEWDSSKGKEGVGSTGQAGTVGWLGWAGPLLPVLCCEQSAWRHNLREGEFQLSWDKDTRKQFGSHGRGLWQRLFISQGAGSTE